MVGKDTFSRKIFNIANFVILGGFCLAIILPFINIIAISLSGYDEIIAGEVIFWPKSFNTEGYSQILTSPAIWNAVVVTVAITVLGTALTIFTSLTAGFALAHHCLKFPKVFLMYFIIVMYFKGGMIPSYITINELGLYNTFVALFLPTSINVFYIIVFRNNIKGMPKELMDSAEIDGAGVFATLFRIVAPLQAPMIAAFTIFAAVTNWNSWYNVLLYIQDESLWTLQYQLREILVNVDLVQGAGQMLSEGVTHPENLKMASLIFTILPIMMIYPFLQKYFMHGIIVGAVKG